MFIEDNWVSRKRIQQTIIGSEFRYVDGYTHDGAGGIYLVRRAG